MDTPDPCDGLRVKIVSDLHFEFHADHGRAFAEGLPNDVDVLIVAGDLATRPILIEAFDVLCPRFPTVVYVEGNHEHYGAPRDEVLRTLDRARRRHVNLRALDKEIAVIDGVRFVGAPLWFAHAPYVSTEGMADFHAIPRFSRWVYDENAAAQAFFARELRPGDVAISHHLPAPQSISPRFRGSSLNAFFLCDVSATIVATKPAIWVHGHTHDSASYRIHDTQVVCNPYGYQHVEVNERFDPNHVVLVARTVA